MSDDKPINAMYGQKVKLDFDKLKDKSNTNKNEEVVETEVLEKQVTENKEVEPVVDEPVEEVSEEVVDEPVEEVSEKSKKEKTSNNDNLKQKLADKDKKLSNQSKELNYLTNNVIPGLKKENAELKKLKSELSQALENTTRKYFTQLDVNADLSNEIGKLGAESAVNKVKADKLESEVDSIKDDLEAKISELKQQIKTTDVDSIKKENDNLSRELEDLKTKLSDSRRENIELSEEVDKLRAEIIDFGNYKEEVEAKSKKEINNYKEEVSELRTKLKVKESSYDKLSNDNNKTISELRKQVKKLEENLEKESNKGLFDRFK